MNIFKSSIIAMLFCCFCLNSYAQQTPAPDQKGSILILNAKAHLGNGKVIENSAVAFKDGKITLVEDATNIRLDMSQFDEVVKAQGMDLYPGFIAPNTQIGIQEIGAVRATRDSREVGRINPSVRTIIAYNTDSRVTPTIRSNGVLLAQVAPSGWSGIKGTSSVVELDAWNWEDAAYVMDDGIHMMWPSMFHQSGWWAEPGPIKKNEEYDKQTKQIKDFFQEAKAYQASTPTKKNLKFEAMKGLFNKSQKLYINTASAKTIMDAVLFGESIGVDVVIIGAEDAWRITDFLKEHEVQIILHQTQSLPETQDADIDQPFKTPAMLQKEGILFCFGVNGSWEQRILPNQAGQAVGYGLEYEDAIAALTLNTAKILGINDRVGSIELGKDATLILSEGDVLEIRTSKVSKAYIRGKAIDLDNKQRALYRKFKEKYEND